MTMRQVMTMAAVLVACASGWAQQPKVIHAQLATRSGDNLQREIGAAQVTTWLAYTVPATHRLNSGWGDNVLRLEGGDSQILSEPDDSAVVPPAMILLRVTAGKVERVVLEQTDREVDAGGLPFVWLTGVNPVESVKTLQRVVEASVAEQALAVKLPAVTTTDRDRARIERDVQREPERELRRVQERGMAAIALTNVPEATAALKVFTAASYSLTVRDRAAFWLANERGAEGFRTDAALLKSDKDDAFREKLTFDLTLVKGESRNGAIDALIAAAKTDAAQKVRSQAQFWLAEMAGKKAVGDARIAGTLRDEAQNDPEVAIRKSAVFALSRLPAEEGVPQLIQVASSSKDAVTRKEAIFWLGKSKDPRALEYLETVVRQ